MDERTVLTRAKEVLLERGWRNDGNYGPDSGKGPVCLVGAIGVAECGDAHTWACGQHPTFKRLASFIPDACLSVERAFGDGTRLVDWNDEYASFEEVIALLDKAIASLETEAPTPELVA